MTKPVLPYSDSEESKKRQVSRMFDNIAPRYDLLNHLLSVGIDRGWRKKVVRLLQKERPKRILDIATGTGDLAIALAKVEGAEIIGADISEGMLQVGRQKIQKLGLEGRITLQAGDAENLPFPDGSFDAVTVAFGVRNFENLEKGLADILRVLRPGGTLAILEFAQPQAFPMKQLYFFYFRNILPLIGRMVSKDESAYTYLPESVASFPYGERLLNIMKKQGFRELSWKGLTFGICGLYVGKK